MRSFFLADTREIHAYYSRYRHLTLLHSNDLHGDFPAEQLDEKLAGSGSLRKPSLGSIVAAGDLLNMYSYDEKYILVTMTGAQLTSAFRVVSNID